VCERFEQSLFDARDRPEAVLTVSGDAGNVGHERREELVSVRIEHGPR
jgi:hypothetical protein